ncbi:MAG: ABC transporter ATP-binding protein [Tissierellia bacterium]|nr:ABC transporter ATP-binding protein [Tissierellia bacterium]
MFKFLLPIALKERKNLILSFLLALSTVGAELASPLILAHLLDKELIEGQGARDPRIYAYFLVAYLIFMILGGLLSYLANYGFQRCANAIASNLQKMVFHRVQKLPVAYFDTHPSGQLVSRLVNDANDVRVLFQTVLSQMLIAALYLIGIYSILFIKDFRMGLIALAPLPLIAGLIVFYSRKSKGYNTKYRRQLSAVNAHISESIQGMSLMQSMGKEGLLLSEYEDISSDLYDTGLQMTKLEALASWNAIGFLGAFTRAMILLFFGLSHFSGKGISLGSMYLLIDFSIKIFNQLQNIMQRIGQLESAKGAYNHLSELLEIPIIPKKEKTIFFKGEVRFQDVTFNYLENQPVLKEVSFHLPPGKTLGIVGTTGSGKSTIMNLVFGFYPYEKGEIFMDNQVLQELNLQNFRAQCAMVLQDPYLMKASLYENIAFNRPEITLEVAKKALEELGGAEMIQRLKKGMDEAIDEGGKNLSAGERQLINFARALAGNPKLLLLDEATASIDSHTEGIIQKSIKRLSQGRSTIIIAHRLSTIQEADEIILLDHGRVLEAGTHNELLEKKASYFNLYTEQLKKETGAAL